MIRNFFLLVLFVVSIGCATPSLNMTIKGGSNQNPDSEGIGLPVVIRVYQLADKVNFLDADYNSLWKADGNILGNDLLFKQETTLFPSTKIGMEIERKEGAKYVAVVAFFRKPSHVGWKKIMKLSKARKHEISISLVQNNINLGLLD